jgi:hypothetical protein
MDWFNYGKYLVTKNLPIPNEPRISNALPWPIKVVTATKKVTLHTS